MPIFTATFEQYALVEVSVQVEADTVEEAYEKYNDGLGRETYEVIELTGDEEDWEFGEE